MQKEVVVTTAGSYLPGGEGDEASPLPPQQRAPFQVTRQLVKPKLRPNHKVFRGCCVGTLESASSALSPGIAEMSQHALEAVQSAVGTQLSPMASAAIQNKTQHSTASLQCPFAKKAGCVAL